MVWKQFVVIRMHKFAY